MFSLFKKKQLFSPEENSGIVDCIRKAERLTSGEVRVYIESKNPFVDPLDRASEIFFSLKMDQTEHRNAVLVYIAANHKEFALFADQGIYEKAGRDFWNSEAAKMIRHFSRGDLAAGIMQCVTDIGNVLQAAFPFEPADDKNELPDEIVFGKM
jgi:uncharacterized membrane protein